MRLSRTPGIKKKCEVSQICKEIPFRQQLGSLADAARGASYGNEAERLLWAPSQTNEIFSDVNTAAIRLQRGEVGVDPDLSACRGRSHGPQENAAFAWQGAGLHACVRAFTGVDLGRAAVPMPSLPCELNPLALHQQPSDSPPATHSCTFKPSTVQLTSS